jgi:hypothetical protein
MPKTNGLPPLSKALTQNGTSNVPRLPINIGNKAVSEED